MKRIGIFAFCMLLASLMMMSGCVDTRQTMESGNEQGRAVQQVQTWKVKSMFKTGNVRSEPSLDAPIIAQVPGGMEVAKVDENAEWIQVKLEMADNSQLVGWMDKELFE